MKIAVLTNATINTVPLYEPIKGLGHDVSVFQYDLPKYNYGSYNYHQDLVEEIKFNNPQMVIYIGAIPEHYDKPVPSAEALRQIGESFPLVHLCCDGSEGVWWTYLRIYYTDCHFALQVNIDGVCIGPIGERGLTTLFPVDFNNWREITKSEWLERPKLCVFPGSISPTRSNILSPLSGLVEIRPRDEQGYDKYQDFLYRSKATINVSIKGSNHGHHVKARSLEGSAAGCLILELEGSALSQWFESDKDYLVYSSSTDARNKINWVKEHPDEAFDMMLRMRQKIKERHSYEVFFSQILERLGMGEAIYPAKSWMLEQPVPYFCELHGNINIIEYNGYFYLYPQHLGAFFPHVAQAERCRKYESIQVARNHL